MLVSKNLQKELLLKNHWKVAFQPFMSVVYRSINGHLYMYLYLCIQWVYTLPMILLNKLSTQLQL